MTRTTSERSSRHWKSLLIVGLAFLAASCGGGFGTKFMPGGQGTPTPGTGAWLGLTMLDDRHGWGLTTHALLRTDDGGGRWVTSGLPLPRGIVLQAFAGTATAWLCHQGAPQGTMDPTGANRASGSLAGCFVSTDGGATWAEQTVPGTLGSVTARTQVSHSLMSLAVLGDGRAWAIVRTTKTFAGGGHESFDLEDVSLLHTVDGGATWTVQRRRAPSLDGSPNSPVGSLWVRFADARTGWMGGFLPMKLEVTHDGGATWQAAPAAIPEPTSPRDRVDLLPVRILARGELVVPVETGPQASLHLTFLISRDSGRTWTARPAQNVTLQYGPQVDVLDGQRWWIVIGKSLYATTDAGSHWAAFQAEAPASELLDVQMLSPKVGLAVGVDRKLDPDRDRFEKTAWRQLLRTEDGGHSWRQVQPGPG